MKRLIKNVEKRAILKIVIELAHVQSSNQAQAQIAASTHYVNRLKLKKQYQLTDSQLNELDHLIHRIIGLLISNDFVINKRAQSSESYTYYIRFTPTDYSRKALSPSVDIQFEVRDHLVKNHPTEGYLNSSIIVKAFYVGDTKCFDTDGVISEVKEICKQLKSGDYSSLLIEF